MCEVLLLQLEVLQRTLPYFQIYFKCLIQKFVMERSSKVNLLNVIREYKLLLRKVMLFFHLKNGKKLAQLMSNFEI